MKIAICYSGNLRTYEFCVKNHFDVIGNKGKCDVYFSTWSEISLVDNINDPWHYKIKLDYPNYVTDEYIEKITPKKFNIRKIKIDKYSDFKPKELKRNLNLNYQYFKIKDCFDLLTDNINEYDFIIRLRPDITIKNIIFDENKLIFNENIWYNYNFSNSKNEINEMIWISNPELMSKSVKIFDNLDIINQRLNINDIYGERICYENLVIENLISKIKYFNFNYNVVR